MFFGAEIGNGRAKRLSKVDKLKRSVTHSMSALPSRLSSSASRSFMTSRCNTLLRLDHVATVSVIEGTFGMLHNPFLVPISLIVEIFG